MREEWRERSTAERLSNVLQTAADQILAPDRGNKSLDVSASIPPDIAIFFFQAFEQFLHGGVLRSTAARIEHFRDFPYGRGPSAPQYFKYAELSFRHVHRRPRHDCGSKTNCL